MENKISVIVVVKNEQDNLAQLLESLLKQSKKPDEIVIVDDNSSDRTPQIIKSYKKNNKNIKSYRVNFSKIAKNRNFGVKMARHSILMFADGGCTYDRDYIKNSLGLFSDVKIDFVGGTTKPVGNSTFEKCLAEYLYKPVSENHPPGSAAFIFRKKLWERIGGFREDLAYSEDSFFIKAAKEMGIRPIFSHNSVLYWRVRKDLKSLSKQFKTYGYWDAKGKSTNSNVKKSLLTGIIFPVAILHAIYKAFSVFRKTKYSPSLFWVPIIDIVKIYSFNYGWVRGALGK
jgi:glycosyltransferase involved in cell wall biosynthesis